jgi:hypothetical protein
LSALAETNVGSPRLCPVGNAQLAEIYAIFSRSVLDFLSKKLYLGEFVSTLG